MKIYKKQEFLQANYNNEMPKLIKVILFFMASIGILFIFTGFYFKNNINYVNKYAIISNYHSISKNNVNYIKYDIMYQIKNNFTIQTIKIYCKKCIETTFSNNSIIEIHYYPQNPYKFYFGLEQPISLKATTMIGCGIILVSFIPGFYIGMKLHDIIDNHYKKNYVPQLNN